MIEFKSTDITYAWLDNHQFADIRMFLFVRNIDTKSPTGCSLLKKVSTIDFQLKSCIVIEIENSIEGRLFITDLDIKEDDQIQYDLVREPLTDKAIEQGATVVKSLISLAFKNKAVKFISGVTNLLIGSEVYQVDSSLLKELKLNKLIFIQRTELSTHYKSVINLVTGGSLKEKFTAKGRNISIEIYPIFDLVGYVFRIFFHAKFLVHGEQ